MRRYTNRPRLWLWLSGFTFIVLGFLPAIPGVVGSRVATYLTSLVGAPVMLLIQPTAGIRALTDAVIGLAFFASLALMLGWGLHCIAIWIPESFREAPGKRTINVNKK